MPTTSTDRLSQIEAEIARLQPDATDSPITIEAKKQERNKLAQELITPIVNLRKGETGFGSIKEYNQQYSSLVSQAQSAAQMIKRMQETDPELNLDFGNIFELYKVGDRTAAWKPTEFSGDVTGIINELSEGRVPEGFTVRKGEPGFEFRGVKYGGSGGSDMLSQGGALTQFEQAQARITGQPTFTMNEQQYAFDPVAENQKQRENIKSQNEERANMGLKPLPIPDIVSAESSPVGNLQKLQRSLDPNAVSVGTAKDINQSVGLMGGTGRMQEGSTGAFQAGTMEDVTGSYRGAITQPTLKRGQQEYGKGTPTGFGSGVTAAEEAFTTTPIAPKLQSTTSVQPDGTRVTQTTESTPPSTGATGTTQSTLTPSRRGIITSSKSSINNARKTTTEAQAEINRTKEIAKQNDSVNASYMAPSDLLQKKLDNLQSRLDEVEAMFPTDDELLIEELSSEIDILNARNEAYGIEEEIKNIKKEAADIGLEEAKYVRDILEIQNRTQIQQAEEDLLDSEIEMRRQLGVTGANTSSFHLGKMKDALVRGRRDIMAMQEISNKQMLQANLPIIRGYQNNIDRILVEYKAGRAQIKAEADSALANIKQQTNLSKKERRDAIIARMNKEDEMKNDLEMKIVDQIGKEQDNAQEQFNEKQKQARENEKEAMERIKYLLSNFSIDDVRDAVKEIAKDIPSLSNVDFTNTIDAQKKIADLEKKNTVASSGGASYFLPSFMQEEYKPSITIDDYVESKVNELQDSLSESFSVEKKAEIIDENMKEWGDEYNAIYVQGANAEMTGNARQEITEQFGENVVQAAELVLNGTYTGTDPIGKASKAMNVSPASVATALTKLRQSGAVADTEILSPAQNKTWESMRKELENDTFYSVYKGATSAVSRIQVAIGDSGGADGLSDIMAINAFQNGIVDPGATVREGDVILMQTAIAWADKVRLSYWKERISDGDKLPPEMRQKMLELAQNTARAYERDFTNNTLPKFKQNVTQAGLPQTVLDQYLPRGEGITTVSKEVEDFASRYFSQ